MTVDTESATNIQDEESDKIANVILTNDFLGNGIVILNADGTNVGVEEEE